MKPTNTREDYNWECIWVKKCGYQVYETFNGTLQLVKKKIKKVKIKLDLYTILCVY